MKAKLLIPTVITIISLFFITCGKGVFTTKPQIKMESVSNTRVPKGSTFKFNMRITDREGDIDSLLWVQRISYRCPDDNNKLDSFIINRDIPRQKFFDAEYTVQYVYDATIQGIPTISPCYVSAGAVNIGDSCYFKMWIKDYAGNVSDTLVTPIIVLERTN